jgi:Autographiviridae endonuclease VII
MKPCTDCGKPERLVQPNGRVMSKCHDCSLARLREWRKSNPERARYHDLKKRRRRVAMNAVVDRTGSKECYLCKNNLPKERFNIDRSKLDGLNIFCRPCLRVTRVKENYGVGRETYIGMLAEQSGLCAICKDINPSGRELGVDHDHETGVARALLCCRCNTMIGQARERTDILMKAIEYLRSYGK